MSPSLLSGEHLGGLAALAIASAVLCVVARLRPGTWIDPACKTLAIVIIAAESSWWFIYLPVRGTWAPAFGLPLHLCDVAGYVAGAALWWRQWLMVELTYFWGLGGSIQGLITPDLRERFPSYEYWQFYVTHGAIVLAALFLVVGLGLRPRRGAVRRIFLITLGFTTLVAGVDIATGGNYMFLRQPPLSGSLLSLMGPWPWYIVSGAVLTLLVLVILDAPFFRRDAA